jgi:FkbM family methyltransferase
MQTTNAKQGTTSEPAAALPFPERILSIEEILGPHRSQSRRPAVYLDDGLALTFALDRYKMYVDTRDKAISVHLLAEGRWEPWITEFLGDLAKPGMNVADVGANMGFYSLLLADRVGPQGRLWAFEPDPRNSRLLEWNLDANGFTPRAKAFRLAAFNRRAQVRLSQETVNLGGHSVIPEGSAAVPGTFLTVDAAPLDDCIDAPLDLMKIDAEGSEPFIWDGMTRLLAESPKVRIVMEFDSRFIASKGRDPAAFLARVRADGFSIARIRTDAGLENASDQELIGGSLSMLYLSRA